MWPEGPVAGLLVGGQASSANRVERGLQNGTCQSQYPCGRASSSNFWCQYVCSQSELQLSPAALEGSPRSAKGSDPGSFQFTGSALGLSSCEIVCVSYTSGIFVSYRPPRLLYVSPASLQGHRFQGFLPGAGPQDWGAWHRVWILCTLVRTATIMIILFIHCLPWLCGSWRYCFSAPPTYLVLVPSSLF